MLSSRQLEATFHAVVRTAGSARLSESHAAAACDALRACLARCEQSAEAEIRFLAYSQKTWVDLFNIFLTTSESRKPKPLKLVLTALERNLSKNPYKSTKDDLIAYVSSSMWQAVCAHSNSGTVKPALQVLRHLLSKSVIQPRDILVAVSQEQSSDEHGRAEISEPSSCAASLESLSTSQCMQYSHVFLCKVLSWLRYPDTAPIAGRLVPTFSSLLRVWSSSWPEPARIEHPQEKDPPIWMTAFRTFLNTHPDCLDLLANHVFPEMVRQDRTGMEEYAPILQNLTIGGMRNFNCLNFQIHLLLLRSVMEHGSSSTYGTYNNPEVPWTTAPSTSYLYMHAKYLGCRQRSC